MRSMWLSADITLRDMSRLLWSDEHPRVHASVVRLARERKNPETCLTRPDWPEADTLAHSWPARIRGRWSKPRRTFRFVFCGNTESRGISLASSVLRRAQPKRPRCAVGTDSTWESSSEY